MKINSAKECRELRKEAAAKEEMVTEDKKTTLLAKIPTTWPDEIRNMIFENSALGFYDKPDVFESQVIAPIIEIINISGKEVNAKTEQDISGHFMNWATTEGDFEDTKDQLTTVLRETQFKYIASIFQEAGMSFQGTPAQKVMTVVKTADAKNIVDGFVKDPRYKQFVSKYINVHNETAKTRNLEIVQTGLDLPKLTSEAQNELREIITNNVTPKHSQEFYKTFCDRIDIVATAIMEEASALITKRLDRETEDLPREVKGEWGTRMFQKLSGDIVSLVAGFVQEGIKTGDALVNASEQLQKVNRDMTYKLVMAAFGEVEDEIEGHIYEGTKQLLTVEEIANKKEEIVPQVIAFMKQSTPEDFADFVSRAYYNVTIDPDVAGGIAAKSKLIMKTSKTSKRPARKPRQRSPISLLRK